MARFTFGKELKIPICLALKEIQDYYNSIRNYMFSDLEYYETSPDKDLFLWLIYDGVPDEPDDGASEFMLMAYGSRYVMSVTEDRKLLYKDYVEPEPSYDQRKVNLILLDDNEQQTSSVYDFVKIDDTVKYLQEHSNESYDVIIGSEWKRSMDKSDDHYISKSNIFQGINNIVNVEINGYVGDLGALGGSVFHGCSKLKSVRISDDCWTGVINSMSFASCYRLEELYIGKGVTRFMDAVCMNDSNLKTVILPDDGFLSIYYDAFYNCSSLKTINIPSSTTAIDSLAFRGCSDITITIEKPNGSILYSPWSATNASVMWTG